MEFIDERLNAYAEKHTSLESELLNELNRQTHLKILQPRMLSGHIQGRLLTMFSHMIQPTCVLEIGTYTGYSALCMAEGLQKDGKLITIDNNEELAPFTKSYFDKSNYAKQIDFRIGNAMEIIPTLSESFDLVFVDADKENYSNYFDLVIDKVRKGGFIIADNVLWSGKVIEPIKPNDKDTLALMEFNKKIHNYPRVENVLAPVRDGLMIIRKID
ncbi:MAG: O-methyltransferase [Bacteroidia bacterium]